MLLLLAWACAGPSANPASTACPWSETERQGLYEDSCGAVLSGAGSSRFGANKVDLAGGELLQLWHAVADDAGHTTALEYAVSGDLGRTWDVEAELDMGWYFDWKGFVSPDVAWVAAEERYLMVWQWRRAFGLERRWGFGKATSEDGVEWNAEEEPFLELDDPHGDGFELCWPIDLRSSSGVPVRGLVATQDALQIALEQPDGVPPACELRGFEESSDGEWRFDDEVAMHADAGEAHAALGFVDATVADVDGADWLFYLGFGEWHRVAGFNQVSANAVTLHVATMDAAGTTWVAHTGPPLVEPDDSGTVMISLFAVQTEEGIVILVGEVTGDGEERVRRLLLEPGLAFEE